MNEIILKQLKSNYNYLLKRFQNGCKYCEEHKEETSKWLPELLNIYQGLNYVLSQIMEHEKVDSKSILEGFDV